MSDLDLAAIRARAAAQYRDRGVPEYHHALPDVDRLLALVESQRAEIERLTEERDQWEADHAERKQERDRWKRMHEDAVILLDRRAESERLLVERLKEERDYWHAVADAHRQRLRGTVTLRGQEPNYWAEWHRMHCAAAQGAFDERSHKEAAEAALADLRAKVDQVVGLAKVQAISCRASHRTDHERNWLDVLALLDPSAKEGE